MKKFDDFAIAINPELDQTAIAKCDIPQGSYLNYKDNSIKIKTLVKRGHRFAITDISKGRFIKQYGYPFGQSKGILKGEIITPTNVRANLPKINIREYKKPKRNQYQKKYTERTFSGFRRNNGTAGTRNYYLVVPTSMCVSEAALQVSASLENNECIVRKYPEIDGIVAIPHTEGCGCASKLQIDRFLRVLKGYIRHPNVGGCLIMDLGCEQTNYEKVYKYLKATLNEDLKPIDWLTVQDCGGIRLATEKARSIIKKRLKQVNLVKREPCLLEKLIVGTECGASDSFSGITANPVIGSTVDKVIYGKGKAILSEIPEMVGAFGFLLPRFKTLKVANSFNEIVKWYVNIAKKLDLTLEDNLVKKNKEGGLINNCIKSLGAVQKGGTTVIEDILDYGEPVKKRGLSIMQGPGGDMESVTGIVASGANIICFSTGFGATTGNAITPVIKISSCNSIAKNLPEDIDFNAGKLLSEQIGIDELSEELLEKVIAVASGEKTWSEKWKQRQFQIWTAGKLPL